MKYSITYKNSLKAFKCANRETMHTIKPIKTIDKKKENNKMECRNYMFI